MLSVVSTIDAIDSAFNEGLLKLNEDRIDVTLIPAERKIIIEDNGIGMDRDSLNQVTDLFFTTKTNGTGLGTSLSKEIIEFITTIGQMIVAYLTIKGGT